MAGSKPNRNTSERFPSLTNQLVNHSVLIINTTNELGGGGQVNGCNTNNLFCTTPTNKENYRFDSRVNTKQRCFSVDNNVQNHLR